MPVALSDLLAKVGQQYGRRHDVHQSDADDRRGMIQSQPMSRSGAAVVSYEMETPMPKRAHQPNLIGCHGPEAVIGQIGLGRWFVGSPIAAQVGTDHPITECNQLRCNPCPECLGLRKAMQPPHRFSRTRRDIGDLHAIDGNPATIKTFEYTLSPFL